MEAYGMVTLAGSKEPRIKKSISLRPDQYEAAVEMAEEERHGNVSLIFQRLIDEAVKQRDSKADEPVESRAA
jgi:hypothetical protein